MTITRIALAFCALVVSGLVLVGCASAPPRVIKAPAGPGFASIEHRIEPRFSYCLTHGKGLTTNSGAGKLAVCMHLPQRDRSGFVICTHNQVLDIGTEMRTPEGHQLFRDAVLACAAQFS